MRAYMSAQGPQNRHHYDSLAEYGVSAAIDEAERILADTEPHDLEMCRISLSKLDHNERAALAEGIAGAIVALGELIDDDRPCLEELEYLEKD